MTKRLRLSLLGSGLFVFITILYMSFGKSGHAGYDSSSVLPAAGEPFGGSISSLGLTDSVLTGGAIAPKLENATIKAELGRSSWRLLHTMMARFPEKPTEDDRLALQMYIKLFARLYPCGDCATHFQMLLQDYPPQTSSRNAAAGWACFVHNEVNKRLQKKLFDCNTIGDFYDCGCGDEEKDGKGKAGAAAGDEEYDDDEDARGDATATATRGEAETAALKVEKVEGLSRGG